MCRVNHFSSQKVFYWTSRDAEKPDEMTKVVGVFDIPAPFLLSDLWSDESKLWVAMTQIETDHSIYM